MRSGGEGEKEGGWEETVVGAVRRGGEWEIGRWRRGGGPGRCDVEDDVSGPFVGQEKREKRDRKSTRLELQSHYSIPYAVFCLKKFFF